MSSRKASELAHYTSGVLRARADYYRDAPGGPTPTPAPGDETHLSLGSKAGGADSRESNR
jgi:hypothetical protein